MYVDFIYRILFSILIRLCIHYAFGQKFGHKFGQKFGQIFFTNIIDIIMRDFDVMVFWSWNPDVVVYVPPRPRFRYHRENKKITHNLSIMLLKNISVVQIYATSICIMYA